METISVRVPEDTLELIEEYQSENSISRSIAIRRLIRDGVQFKSGTRRRTLRSKNESKDKIDPAPYFKVRTVISVLICFSLFLLPTAMNYSLNVSLATRTLELLALLFPAVALFVQAVINNLETPPRLDNFLICFSGLFYLSASAAVVTIIGALGGYPPIIGHFIIFSLFVLFNLSAEILANVFYTLPD